MASARGTAHRTPRCTRRWPPGPPGRLPAVPPAIRVLLVLLRGTAGIEDPVVQEPDLPDGAVRGLIPPTVGVHLPQAVPAGPVVLPSHPVVPHRHRGRGPGPILVLVAGRARQVPAHRRPGPGEHPGVQALALCSVSSTARSMACATVAPLISISSRAAFSTPSGNVFRFFFGVRRRRRATQRAAPSRPGSRGTCPHRPRGCRSAPGRWGQSCRASLRSPRLTSSDASGNPAVDDQHGVARESRFPGS